MNSTQYPTKVIIQLIGGRFWAIYSGQTQVATALTGTKVATICNANGWLITNKSCLTQRIQDSLKF